jgi:hypothetical protein
MVYYLTFRLKVDFLQNVFDKLDILFRSLKAGSTPCQCPGNVFVHLPNDLAFVRFIHLPHGGIHIFVKGPVPFRWLS